MTDAMPARLVTVFSTWELVGVIFPLGEQDHATKTFVHRKESRYSLTRYLHGQLVGHLVITQAEFNAIENLI